MNRMLRVMRVVALVATAIALFALAMFAAYSLPNRRVLDNARESVDLLGREGLWPRLTVSEGTVLDNFTDALMIDVAVVGEGRSVVEAALLNERNSGDHDTATIGALRRTVAGDMADRIPYPRYWHGYQVLLRPALVFFNYPELRYLNSVLVAMVGLAVALAVLRSAGRAGLIAFTLALALTGFAVVPLSLQFSVVTYLTFAAVLTAVALERRGLFDRYAWEFYALTGALTAFADLLTAPLLTLGLPLGVIMLSRARGEALRWNGVARESMTAALCWGFGYGFTWVSKWVVAEVVVGGGVFADVLGAAGNHTGFTKSGYSAGGALLENARMLVPMLIDDQGRFAQGGGVGAAAFTVALVAMCVAVALGARVSSKRGNDVAGAIRGRLPLLLVAALPLAWIALFRGHATIHGWFTYRALAVSLFVLLAIGLSWLDGGTSVEV